MIYKPAFDEGSLQSRMTVIGQSVARLSVPPVVRAREREMIDWQAVNTTRGITLVRLNLRSRVAAFLRAYDYE
jgi:hypothetical protein